MGPFSPPAGDSTLRPLPTPVPEWLATVLATTRSCGQPERVREFWKLQGGAVPLALALQALEETIDADPAAKARPG